jgi:chromatin assembly factor 1 subunit A
MSEKKGLKQSRLPFQIISTSPKVSGEHKASPVPVEKSSPKTPVTSRKRKPSNEGDNIRSSKIGRTNSKENIIAEQDPIEIVDSSDEEVSAVNTTLDESIVSVTETTPTAAKKSTPQEKKLRIKIQSCSKRKQVVKPIEVHPDDSVVYLDDEEIQSAMNKKSTKKSEKKKATNQKVLREKSKRIKKSLNLNQDEDQGTKTEKAVETKTSESMEIDDEVHVFDDNDNERSDVESSAAEDKIAAVKDRLEESMDKMLRECKTVSIVLNKVSMDDNKEVDTSIIQEKLDESKTDLDESVMSSEKDESPEKSMSESEESPKVANNNELSEEISKLVDNSPQSDDSANKDLHDEFVEIFTDDEKKSPTNPNTPNITKTTLNLTPKALARRKDQEAKRIEKELQRQKEKDEKEKQRIKEKEMRDEAKRKEREEKEELRKREKEEREKKRLAELEKKEEEKRQKEDERKRLAEQKEEEKRMKDEERRQKEEERKRQNEAREEEKKKKELEKIKEDERKKKAAQAFTKFFVAKKKNDPQIDDDASKESAECSDVAIGNFMPFQIHGKMRLAPRIRNEISKAQKERLDEILKSDGSNNDRSKLYVQQLKSVDYVPKSSSKTWPEEDKDDEIVVIDELEGVGEDIKEDEAHSKIKYRAKLLLFEENKRPAYYGTWRKKSKSITARRPFVQDSKFFDYEVDSDDEWEEEEPGESLHGSDSEKEKEKDDDDYELDDDFFVPHGHLSEDEKQNDDEIMDDNSPETQKAKLKVLQQEFAAEMKKKTEKIKPRLIGCIWMNGDEDEDGGSKNANLETKYHCSDIIWRILKAREMFSSGDEIKMEDFEPEIIESEEDNHTEEKSSTKQPKTPAQIRVRIKLEGESVKELIRLVNYNINSKKFIIKEYQAYRLKNYHKLPEFHEFQVKSVEEKINEVSVYKTCPEEGPLFGKKCWCVKEDVIKEYFGDEKLPMPNQWTYILEKEKKTKPPAVDSKKGSREVTPTDEKMSVTENPQSTELMTVPESPKPINSSKITNFVKSSPKSASATKPKAVQSPKPSTSKTPIQNKPTTNASPKVQSTAANSGKKRVAILMSVQRGQSINQEKKNLVINEFLQTNQKKDVPPLNENEIIEID